MGATDYGTQTITLDFRASADSVNINRRHVDVVETGIYTGGYLTKISNTIVSLGALMCMINDGSYQVRVSTSVAVNVTVSSGATYVILRWAYTGATGNYMDVLAVGAGDIQDTDLIVGKCSYSGSTLTGFDYSTRSDPETFGKFLKVEPTIAASMAVRVRSGRVSFGNTCYEIENQTTSVMVAPSSNPRIDVICIDTDGTITIVTGTEAASPSVPALGDKIPLAQIALTTATTSITADEITDARPFLGWLKNVVHTTGNQTIAGVKTFTSIPVGPSSSCTTDNQYARKKYVDDLISAVIAMIPSDRVASQATGTSTVTIPLTESDADNMSVTLTTTGTKLLVMFSATFYNPGADHYLSLYVYVDGVSKRFSYQDIASEVNNQHVNTHWLETGLTPGSHTVKIRWKISDSSVVVQRGTTDGPRVLTVVDLD